jgi:DNA-binding MarR family transcriptional regulator
VDTRWLDDDELDAWVRFIAVVERLPAVLDSQLRRDSALTHYEYFVLATLSEAPGRTLRMTALATRTNATLPRLSHVVSRMEQRGLVQRSPCPQDRRAFNVALTDAGWDTLVAAAPGHVATVREHVIDALSPEQVGQLAQIATALLGRLDPQGASSPPARRPRTDTAPDAGPEA